MTPLGDYSGLPITDGARKFAESWDPSRITLPEEQCRVHVSPYIYRGPIQLRVAEIRDPETHELLNRFRTDAHQIVDLLVDVVGTSFDALGRVADQGISIGLPIDKLVARAARNGSPNPVNGGSTGTVSVLDAVETVGRGGDARLSMAVTNSSDSTTEPFSLVASDLISDAGQRIAATHVSFEPASVALAAKASERVTIKVHVPGGIDPGRYAGLVQATNLEHVRAVLTITVT